MINTRRIGIVILNFNNYIDTIDCVNSILLQTYTNYFIIIVDNGSINNSFEILYNMYNRNTNIKILKSNKNLGFARGNNIGINFAYKQLNCKYVFIVNSDIIFTEHVFDQIMLVDHKNIGVISPVIHCLDGSLQMPTINSDNITKTLIEEFIKIFYEVIVYFIKNIFIKLLKFDKKKFKNKKTIIPILYDYPPILHKYSIMGCAFCLTPSFFKYYSVLYPKTFLYWEELNLMWYLKKVRLYSKIIYTSPVYHKGGKSILTLINNQEIKKIYRLKLSIKSMIKSTTLFFMSYEQIKRRYNNKKF
jgi:GT2 family glycosyltransferase